MTVRRLPPDANLGALFGVDPEDPPDPGRSNEPGGRHVKPASFAQLLTEHPPPPIDSPPQPGPQPRLPRAGQDGPRPEEELDLHGVSGLEAPRVVADFVRDAGTRGRRVIRVITGKGHHSGGRPVLPDITERALAALRREGRVLTFRWDTGRKRTSGSLIVHLPPR